MKILFALNQDLNNDLELKISNEYKKEYGYSFEFDKALSIDEIKGKLKDFDLLILNEELELNNPMPLKEIEEIKKMAKTTRIILIASSENKTEDFIKKVSNLGIYNLMFSEDISMENIIFLIENPKGALDFEKDIQKKEVEKQKKNNKIKNDKNDINFKNKHSPITAAKTIVLGVGGVSNSSGVTHTTLAAATFLKRIGRKVAVIEFSTNPRLKSLLIEAEYTNEEERFFTLNGIDFYYQNVNNHRIEYFNDILSEAKSKNYKYIVIDFGTLKEINSKGIVEPNFSYEGMARTDSQILCLNGSSWKYNDVNFYRYDDFAKVEPNISEWILSISFVTDNRFRDIKKEVENISVIRKIKKSPIYLNPFNIDESNTLYLEGLLKDIVFQDRLDKNNGLLKIFDNKLN